MIWPHADYTSADVDFEQDLEAAAGAVEVEPAPLQTVEVEA